MAKIATISEYKLFINRRLRSKGVCAKSRGYYADFPAEMTAEGLPGCAGAGGEARRVCAERERPREGPAAAPDD